MKRVVVWLLTAALLCCTAGCSRVETGAGRASYAPEEPSLTAAQASVSPAPTAEPTPKPTAEPSPEPTAAVTEFVWLGHAVRLSGYTQDREAIGAVFGNPDSPSAYHFTASGEETGAAKALLMLRLDMIDESMMVISFVLSANGTLCIVNTDTGESYPVGGSQFEFVGEAPLAPSNADFTREFTGCWVYFDVPADTDPLLLEAVFDEDARIPLEDIPVLP